MSRGVVITGSHQRGEVIKRSGLGGVVIRGSGHGGRVIRETSVKGLKRMAVGGGGVAINQLNSTKWLRACPMIASSNSRLLSHLYTVWK